MAAIIIDELKRKEDRPLYTDLRLDLSLNYVYDPRLQSRNNIKDINASYDLEAIKNSLFNLFTTLPGQKILNPVYGLNLMQYLFTGITDDNAQAIGETILAGITKYEPRVVVRKVYVIPDPENNTYQIGLRLDVPTLNITGIQLKGALTESGYYSS
jgi:phage baseplate assembly protein W